MSETARVRREIARTREAVERAKVTGAPWADDLLGSLDQLDRIVRAARQRKPWQGRREIVAVCESMLRTLEQAVRVK